MCFVCAVIFGSHSWACLFVFSISSAGQAYLIKVHAYLKGVLEQHFY